MKPKEKATFLYNKFYNTSFHQVSVKERNILSKECAIICVDEILTAKHSAYPYNDDVFNGEVFDEFWNQVKQEINKLKIQ